MYGRHLGLGRVFGLQRIYLFPILIVMNTQLFRSKDFRLFLFRLFVFLFTLFAADFLIGTVLRKMFFRQQSGPDSETIYAVEKSKEEMLVFGSSRARHHYYPPVFEEKLGLTVYNVGRNGVRVLYYNGVLQSVLSRYTPKIIVLDIFQYEFEEQTVSYDQLACLLPYYKDHPEIRPTVELRGRFEKFKLISNIYPYNSSLISIALGNSEYNKKREETIKGYSPLSRAITNDPIVEDNNDGYKIDSVKVKAYEDFILACKNKGITLFISCSPYYNSFKNEDPSMKIAMQIASKHNVPFWDFSNAPGFAGQSGQFYDLLHLNHEAATRYSLAVAQKIKGFLSENAPNSLSR